MNRPEASFSDTPPLLFLQDNPPRRPILRRVPLPSLVRSQETWESSPTLPGHGTFSLPGRMSALVVGVTPRRLVVPCRATPDLLSLGTAHFPPVLPEAQESGPSFWRFRRDYDSRKRAPPCLFLFIRLPPLILTRGGVAPRSEIFSPRRLRISSRDRFYSRQPSFVIGKQFYRLLPLFFGCSSFLSYSAPYSSCRSPIKWRMSSSPTIG